MNAWRKSSVLVLAAFCAAATVAPGDFRGHRWGDTVSDVRARETAKAGESTNGNLNYIVELIGYEFTLTYTFGDGA